MTGKPGSKAAARDLRLAERPDAAAAAPAGWVEIDGEEYLAFADEGPSTPERAGAEEGSVRRDAASGELFLRGRHYLLAAAEACRPGAEPAAAGDPVALLTPRELQVVLLLAEGRVNKQVAATLRISEWTVSTHIRRIYAKLGVCSRAAMVCRCWQVIRQADPGAALARHRRETPEPRWTR